MYRPVDLLKTLSAKIDGFVNLPKGEKVLQAMAYLADTVKVHEEGNNRGEWVESFLENAGVEPGNPWCASAIAFCCDCAGVGRPKVGAAAVVNWRNWARQNSRVYQNPSRGKLCYMMHTPTTGHIGIVVRSGLGLVYSIEGNTSSGEHGSQRDGDGLFRRVRRASFWDGYISLD